MITYILDTRIGTFFIYHRIYIFGVKTPFYAITKKRFVNMNFLKKL